MQLRNFARVKNGEESVNRDKNARRERKSLLSASDYVSFEFESFGIRECIEYITTIFVWFHRRLLETFLIFCLF